MVQFLGTLGSTLALGRGVVVEDETEEETDVRDDDIEEEAEPRDSGTLESVEGPG